MGHVDEPIDQDSTHVAVDVLLGGLADNLHLALPQQFLTVEETGQLRELIELYVERGPPLNWRKVVLSSVVGEERVAKGFSG